MSCLSRKTSEPHCSLYPRLANRGLYPTRQQDPGCSAHHLPVFPHPRCTPLLSRRILLGRNCLRWAKFQVLVLLYRTTKLLVPLQTPTRVKLSNLHPGPFVSCPLHWKSRSSKKGHIHMGNPWKSIQRDRPHETNSFLRKNPKPPHIA